MDAQRRLALMSSVDRAWLEMDEPRNPMVVSAIFELEGRSNPAAVGRTVSQRLMRYPRFRQRADDRHHPPLWIEDEAPDMDYHVHVRHLDGDDAEAQLHSGIAAEMAFELDRFRPLWRLVLFARRGAPLTVLFRAHHALADGIALMHVLLNCTDEAVAKLPHEIHPIERRAHGGPLGRLIDRLEAVNRTLEGLRRVAREGLHNPQELLQQLRDGRHMFNAVGRLLTLPENNPHELRRPLRGHRAVAWVEGISFQQFHDVAQQRGVKINDLFMAWVAAAFGRYLRAARPDLPEDQNLRISIPVNLRNHDDGGELGNCFGLVLLDLPVGLRDPQQRLQVITERMNALKDSSEARAVLLSLAAAGHLPIALEKKLVNQVAGKAAAVVSNLRGPQHALKIGGHKIRHVVFWPPQSGGIGVGLSLFSYDGKVSIGVSADTALIGNPQRLMKAFHETMEEEILPAQRRRAARPRKVAARKNEVVS